MSGAEADPHAGVRVGAQVEVGLRRIDHAEDIAVEVELVTIVSQDVERWSDAKAERRADAPLARAELRVEVEVGRVAGALDVVGPEQRPSGPSIPDVVLCVAKYYCFASAIADLAARTPHGGIGKWAVILGRQCAARR